jgi:hypothetical protein
MVFAISHSRRRRYLPRTGSFCLAFVNISLPSPKSVSSESYSTFGDQPKQKLLEIRSNLMFRLYDVLAPSA